MPSRRGARALRHRTRAKGTGPWHEVHAKERATLREGWGGAHRGTGPSDPRIRAPANPFHFTTD